jgi:hypothetical protein
MFVFLVLLLMCIYILLNTTRERIFIDEKGNVVSHKELEVEEQKIASKYIRKNDKVLELGARYGTVSAIILDKISDPKDCVIVDPDTNITQALTHNLNNCGYGDAQIFVGTVGSNKKRIHSDEGYGTYTESCENDECNLENATYDNLQRKYDITFNTIVADCEGCLPELIDHIEDMDPIKKIIFETDRPGDVDYNKVYTKLNECGFKNVREGFVQVWVK